MKGLPVTEEDWLNCLVLPEYIAMIPVGHIMSIVGKEQWIDGNGDSFTKEEYISAHGVDPEVGWAAIKAYLRTNGPGIHKEA